MNRSFGTFAARDGEILPPPRGPATPRRRRAGAIDIHPAFDAVDTAAPLRGRAVRKPQPLPLWLFAALIAAAAITIAIGLRARIVETIPALSDAYTAVGLPAGPAALALTDIRVVRIYSRGLAGLNLEGTIANPTGRLLTVPAVELIVRDAAGNVLRSMPLSPTRSALDPGGNARIAAALSPLPVDAFDLAVRLGAGPWEVIPIN